MLPEKNELSQSIQRLEQNCLYCYPYDAFGHDNVAKIKLMIEVIKMDRSKTWINSTFLTSDELLLPYPDNVMWQAGIDARDWLDGKMELDDLLFPENNQNKPEEKAVAQ